jgi:hypothetical protein
LLQVQLRRVGNHRGLSFHLGGRFCFDIEPEDPH